MRKSVLIVEDNTNTIKMLKEMVLAIDDTMKVYCTSQLEAAYRLAMEKEIDLFLIDIVLNPKEPDNLSGIVFTTNIREITRYRFVPLIFITSLEDPRMYAFKELHSYDYIEKPFDIERTKRTISNALKYNIPKETDRTIYFRKDGILFSVQLNDIIYIESIDRKVEIHTIRENITVPYKTCEKILQELDSEILMQCSRKVIVNKKYIENIDVVNRYIHLIKDYGKLEIGITYAKRVKKEIEIW